jgi:hypothetical protein
MVQKESKSHAHDCNFTPPANTLEVIIF